MAWAWVDAMAFVRAAAGEVGSLRRRRDGLRATESRSWVAVRAAQRRHAGMAEEDRTVSAARVRWGSHHNGARGRWVEDAASVAWGEAERIDGPFGLMAMAAWGGDGRHCCWMAQHSLRVETRTREVGASVGLTCQGDSSWRSEESATLRRG